MKTISGLQKEIERLQRQQRFCNHSFGEPSYSPEIKCEEYLTGCYTTHGVHLNYTVGYRDVKVDRWKRVCSVCGKEEYTYQSVNVAKPNMQPKF